MCMLVNEGAKIRRSFRKVPCWKVVEWDSVNCTWTGPIFSHVSYVKGKKLKSDECIKVKFGIVTHGLYTYADESDARKFLKSISKIIPDVYRLMYCEIPRFCRYIENEKGLDFVTHCYASDGLKVVKFV